MTDQCWCDTDHDNGCANAILKYSAEARMWYLKTDVKVRLKSLLLSRWNFQEIIYLWKQLQSIKKDFGEQTSSAIIQQAIKEFEQEFPDSDWSEIVHEKIAQDRAHLNDDSVVMI